MIFLYGLAPSTLSGQARSSCLAAFDDAAGASERARLAQFRREQDRQSYRLTQGFLRLVLAREVGRDPESLVFTTAPGGKPICLEGPFFNVSHAPDRTMVAISHGLDVGVDIEVVLADGGDIHSVPMAVAEEDRRVLPLLSDRGDHGETLLWSIKEAALKLTGEVMVDPGHVAVRCGRNGTFRVGPSRAATAPIHDTFVRQFWLDENHVISLATFEPVSVSQITVMPDCWHGPPGPNIAIGRSDLPAALPVPAFKKTETFPPCPTRSAA